jgi:hypothetical protein
MTPQQIDQAAGGLAAARADSVWLTRKPISHSMPIRWKPLAGRLAGLACTFEA